jgi:hypothetical protein
MWLFVWLLCLGVLGFVIYHVRFSIAQFEKLPHHLPWAELQRISTKTDEDLVLNPGTKTSTVAPVYVESCERQDGISKVQYYKRLSSTSERFVKKQVCLLHLVLYSENLPEYKDMYRATSRLYREMQIETLYYTFRKEQRETFVLEGDVLYLKGTETYVPGILDKTMRTLEYTCNRSYDYVIRSNISTVVNFPVLLAHFLAHDLPSFHYGGPEHLSLSWFDTAAGISDRTYWGLEYIGGTCILLSKALVTRLLYEVSEHIPYDVVDDVALGYVVKHHTPYAPKVMKHLQCHVSRSNLPKILSRHVSDIACYRNKSRYRATDVKHVQRITNRVAQQAFEKHNRV